MRLDQLFILLLCALVLIALGKIVADAYDEIEFIYDPATGRQGFKARKNRLLAAATPPALEGK